MDETLVRIARPLDVPVSVPSLAAGKTVDFKLIRNS